MAESADFGTRTIKLELTVAYRFPGGAKPGFEECAVNLRNLVQYAVEVGMLSGDDADLTVEDYQYDVKQVEEKPREIEEMAKHTHFIQEVFSDQKA